MGSREVAKGVSRDVIMLALSFMTRDSLRHNIDFYFNKGYSLKLNLFHFLRTYIYKFIYEL